MSATSARTLQFAMMLHRGILALILLLTVACGDKRIVTPADPSPAPADSVPDVVISVDKPTVDSEEELVVEETGERTVNNVTRLIHAIGSDRTIRLRPGSYDFGAEPGATTDHVRWDPVHDGHELVIHDVENLTIEAASDDRPLLLAQPRYAFVLKLINVKNITFKNLILGHTPAGGCTGGVVGVEKSENVLITGSDLFGSGTVGVSLNGVKKFRFEKSSIRECTYGIAYVTDATDVSFIDSKFTDNAEYDLVEVTGSPDVHFERCTFSKNRTNKGYGNVFFKTDAKSSVVLHETKFENNQFDLFTNAKARLKITGGKTTKTSKLLSKPDPLYNQIYTLARYQKWIVAGTQAGIVFWNRSTGTIDKLVKAYISSDLMVRGKYLWAGTYRRVIRFDGLKSKNYLPTQKARGGRLIAAPGGKLVVHQKKLVQQPNHWWEYQPKRDRFVPLAVSGPRATPKLLGGASFGLFHDVVVRKNGEIWGIDFLRSLVKHRKGKTTVLPIKGSAYPGTDPRELYEDPRGFLWAIDFGSGFLRYDPKKGTFASMSPVHTKGSEMVIDAKRKRSWFLHYTQGLHLEEKRKSSKFFNLSRLQYMRALLLDKDGSVWVGGWNALVHIERQGASGWRERSFEVK